LPRDLQQQASRRLGIMALVGGVLWLIAPALGHIGQPGSFPEPMDFVSLVSLVVSFALFVYTRQHGREPQFILDLGLWYLVYTGLALGFTAHLTPSGLDTLSDWRPSPEISWLGAVVLMFAAIVPTAPRKMLVAGFAAVSMNPIGMLIGLARGTWQFGPPIKVLLMHYPDYLLLGVAVVISHVVTQVGRQVTKARELGSYELGDLLGSGGMGEVHRATHRMLARPAAIKLIRPEMLAGSDELRDLVVQRFYREAGVAASLRSPHTVEVYDFGVTEDDTLYLAMELLEGMNLESLVEHHGPLPPGRVIYILRQVCDSLEEAHVRGLVHRDIKPANIHIGCIGLHADFVKVLDFGLVKTPARFEGEPAISTATGMVVGTPAYMAPELAFGEAVGATADLYAVGCVAYFLLTGKTLFEADNPLQMVAKHLQAEPVPPSRRAEQEIPRALENVVLACLAKDPSKRPQSAATLAHKLASLSVHRWTETDAVRWWAANAKLSTMSVGAVLPSPGLLSLEMMDAVHTAAMPQ
jgi:serine/threonine-protein kinase